MSDQKARKKFFVLGFNPLRWIGVERIQENGKMIRNLFNHFFSSKSASVTTPVESFEACLQRYGIDEEALQKRMRSARQFVALCLVSSLLLLGYTIYLFHIRFVLSGFVTSILTCLLWAYAFREHFRYFQMKQRRLGCTFQEWLFGLVKGSKQ